MDPAEYNKNRRFTTQQKIPLYYYIQSFTTGKPVKEQLSLISLINHAFA